MHDSKAYDIIVTGAGCAGISFVSALNEINQSVRILILEKEPSIKDMPLKTWSFWTGMPNEFKSLAWHEWNAWYLSDPSRKETLFGNNLCYQSIHSDVYLEHSIKRIKKNKNITLLFNQDVHDIHYISKQQCDVITCSEIFRSNWVIDTRPPSIKKTFELIQSFKGHHVKTQKPFFDPTKFGLMEQLEVLNNDIKFTYLLPKNEYECLIETTFLRRPSSHPNINLALEKDLKRICKDTVYEITRTETGHLPMTSMPFKQPKHKRHIVAGQAAGALRPSSGYAFQRIVLWAKHAANSYHNSQYIPFPTYHSRFIKIMDKIFLNTLNKSPKDAPDLFLALAKCLNGDEFGRFMMNQASFSVWRKIIQALPTKTMLQGLTSDREAITN